MKSWCVDDKWEPSYGSEIIFAETGGKAKSYALSLDTFEDSEYVDLCVRRTKYFDKYYKDGKKYMDFDNDEDRIALCKYGFHCNSDYIIFNADCPKCPAKEFCELYKDYLEERN